MIEVALLGIVVYILLSASMSNSTLKGFGYFLPFANVLIHSNRRLINSAVTA